MATELAPAITNSTSTPSASATMGESATFNGHDHQAAGHHGSMAQPAAGRTKEQFDWLMVERFTTGDALHLVAEHEHMARMRETLGRRRDRAHDYRLLRNEYRPWFPPSRLYGEGYNGFANGYTENGMQPPVSRIVYPAQKPRPGRRITPAFKYPRKDMLKQAEQPEELVPLRLEAEWDKIKLRDTFTWNLHERLLQVELFAAQLLEDMGVKPPAAQPIFDQIVQQMREQLTEYYPFVYSEEDVLDPELPYSAYKNDEMRILIKLNITIGQHTLIDQFEWEINNPDNSPENFAAALARDLSLSGEFVTAIAHCIREQSQLFTKSLYSVGHPFDGRPIEDTDLVASFLQTPLPLVFRPQQQAKKYAPYVYELSDADLERNEIFSREQRRQKRSINRRGGPQLPDLKDRQRTIRTLVVSSVLPGAATDLQDSGLYKRAAGASRRKAVRDGDLSESDDSGDSTPESPAPSQLAAGTARTRGMRGAASAAQQCMANLGRSETPDTSAVLHHHETRTSRRFREETDEPQRLMVTLRVGRDRLRRMMMSEHHALWTPSQPHTPPSLHGARANSTPRLSKLKPPFASSAGPTATSAPPLAAGSYPPGQIGRLPAPPHVPDQAVPEPPPPPEWLVTALKQLAKQYPHGDKFEATMKYSFLDSVTELPVQGQPLSEGVKFAWLPRIRCLDCTTKLYTPGPDMTAQKFEAHLRFSGHRDKVRRRLAAVQQGSG